MCLFSTNKQTNKQNKSRDPNKTPFPKGFYTVWISYAASDQVIHFLHNIYQDKDNTNLGALNWQLDSCNVCGKSKFSSKMGGSISCYLSCQKDGIKDLSKF